MALFGSLRGVTIVAPDLDAAVAAYGDHLGYRGGPVTRVEEPLAAAWGSPSARGCRMATLYPESDGGRFVRLVESDVAEAVRPFASAGWSAAEVVVQDLNRTADRLAASSAFEIIGPPAVLEFEFTDRISAMQVLGPSREVLYLTQIDGEVPGFALPEAACAVDSLFVAVLATGDFAASVAWYAERAGIDPPPVINAPVKVISAALGLPANHRHRLGTVALADRTLVEIDDLPPPHREARPRSACGLPAGIAIVSVDALGAGRDGVVQGPDGELVELIAAQ